MTSIFQKQYDLPIHYVTDHHIQFVTYILTDGQKYEKKTEECHGGKLPDEKLVALSKSSSHIGYWYDMIPVLKTDKPLSVYAEKIDFHFSENFNQEGEY